MKLLKEVSTPPSPCCHSNFCPAIKAFDEKEVAALKALDPSCPALGMYPDAIDQTRKTIQKWKVDWPAAILYSIANGNANAWLRNLKKLIAELSVC